MENEYDFFFSPSIYRVTEIKYNLFLPMRIPDSCVAGEFVAPRRFFFPAKTLGAVKGGCFGGAVLC